MNTVFVMLTSAAGDSPGYIREGLAKLAPLGDSAINSDLYVSQPHPHAATLQEDGPPCVYSVVARLETQLSAPAIARHLAAIERFYEREPDHESGQKPLALSLIGQDAETHSAPILLALREIAPNFRLHSKRTNLDELIAALPPDNVANVVRIANTAQLRRPPAVDYDAPNGAGSGYDQLRPLSRFDTLLFEGVARSIALRSGIRVLDVGCGTGRFSQLLARAGARVTGLDKSETMLAAARANAQPSAGTLKYVRGDVAAGLPTLAFDAVTFFFSAQYMLFDEMFWSALAHSVRPGGAVAFATFSHRHFAEHELTRYFPSIPAIDLARFPSVPALTSALREQGWQDITVEEIVHSAVTPAADLLARVERKYISTLHLVSAAEYEAGLRMMQAALRGQATIARMLRAVVVSGRRPA